MQGRHLAIAVLLLAGPLTGCIGNDPDTSGNEQDVQPANATVLDPGTIETETLEGEAVFSVATPAVSFNFNPATAEGPFLFEFDQPANATGYVLEVTWEPTTPASETLDLWVRDASEGNIPPSDPSDPVPAGPTASATGSSPLKLAVPEGELDEDTDYNIIVRAPSEMGVGVTVDQPFTLHLTTFVDRSFEPGYSALEDADGGG